MKCEYSFRERLNQSGDTSLLTEYNLETTEDSIENGLNLSKSSILGPFNSLNKFEENNETFIEELLVDRKAFKLKSKLREFDRRYEQDNNSNADNGTYVKINDKNIKKEKKNTKKIKKDDSFVPGNQNLKYRQRNIK